jgi:phosphate transport system substrate-binding protein
LAYAVTNHLAFAAVRNHDGHFVVPSVATTAIAAAHGAAIMKQDVRVSIVDSPGAQTYPIVGFTYILVYKHQQDAAKGAILLKFLHWALKDGQKYAAGLYYAPLPKSIVALDEEKLASVK